MALCHWNTGSKIAGQVALPHRNIHLLIPKRNPVNGYREYTEEDILLLNRIKMLRMLDIPVSDIRKILYEKEALTSVLNTHLLKIKEEENRLRQNYFLCEELIKMDIYHLQIIQGYLEIKF